ncbi:hypothetical protein [Bosea sp. RAC05]|uniref:hypothetical protein n=1 Tax=Bosea sp. RAC05 TaxID=1842539 RepID=UPI00083DBA08|nr:hypothetical protein [Bosea sp. RAC05]AOG06148.1 hypothetical protein BSY19_3005 [Bosea sp. RAC05]
MTTHIELISDEALAVAIAARDSWRDLATELLQASATHADVAPEGNELLHDALIADSDLADILWDVEHSQEASETEASATIQNANEAGNNRAPIITEVNRSKFIDSDY